MNEHDEKELVEKVEKLEQEVGKLRENQKDARQRARSAVGFMKRVLGSSSVTLHQLRQIILEAVSHFAEIGKDDSGEKKQ